MIWSGESWQLSRMHWDRHAALSREWIEKTGSYVGAVNTFVARGIASDWKDAGEEPVDERTHELGARVVDVVREANEAGAWRELRARFPPAHAPLLELPEAAGGLVPKRPLRRRSSSPRGGRNAMAAALRARGRLRG